jgi:hypothetical protein
MSTNSEAPEVMLRQADDLGGGVYKKRLSKNLYRFRHPGERRQVLGVCLSLRKEGSSQY